jgi:hypothetical protein
MHGNWPSKIHLYPFFIDELRDKLSPAEFQRLESKVTLIPNENKPFMAFDEAGNRFDYQRQRSPERDRDNRAIDWLEVNEPDYED